MKYQYNDGGRSKYFKGKTGDCVCRSFAITLNRDYKEIYNELKELAKNIKPFKRKTKKHLKNIENWNQESGLLVRQGFPIELAEYFLDNLQEFRIKRIGACKLDSEKLQKGNFIVFVRRHFVSIIDGVLQDTWDSRMRSAGSDGFNTWDADYRTATRVYKIIKED